MKLADLIVLKGSSTLPFPIRSKAIKWGKLIINHKVAIPVINFASYYKTLIDIPILNETGVEIAVLCFTKELGKISWHQLTDNQYIGFLTEAQYSERNDEYNFLYNYLIVQDQFYLEYLTSYLETSSLWGGFTHYNPLIKTTNHSISVPQISLKKIELKPQIFLENSVRGIAQPYGFERFLKLYHLLELRFDYDVIKKIKNLDVNLNPEEIGQLLTEYSYKELKRLTDILLSYCSDLDPIVVKLNELKYFSLLANDLFFKFGSGKEGNPFNKEEIKFNLVLPLGFEESHLKTIHVNYQGNYKNFILCFTAYVIYRIRCSIAHNKLGEYILSMDQEDFIVEFGEPLLKEVLFQCFKA